MVKGLIAEGMNVASIHFWVYIKYMYNCHVSGELQGFDGKFKNFKHQVIKLSFI